jgi:hypothetical protein
VCAFRFRGFRLFCGIPEYLPGSKLERLNVKSAFKQTAEEALNAPKVLKVKPQKKKAVKV